MPLPGLIFLLFISFSTFSQYPSDFGSFVGTYQVELDRRVAVIVDFGEQNGPIPFATVTGHGTIFSNFSIQIILREDGTAAMTVSASNYTARCQGWGGSYTAQGINISIGLLCDEDFPGMLKTASHDKAYALELRNLQRGVADSRILDAQIVYIMPGHDVIVPITLSPLPPLSTF